MDRDDITQTISDIQPDGTTTPYIPDEAATALEHEANQLFMEHYQYTDNEKISEVYGLRRS